MVQRASYHQEHNVCWRYVFLVYRLDQLSIFEHRYLVSEIKDLFSSDGR